MSATRWLQVSMLIDEHLAASIEWNRQMEAASSVIGTQLRLPKVCSDCADTCICISREPADQITHKDRRRVDAFVGREPAAPQVETRRVADEVSIRLRLNVHRNKRWHGRQKGESNKLKSQVMR